MDALTETSTLPLTGKVKVVAVEGTSSNGVTSYNVTVEITGVTDPRTLLAGLGRSNNSNSNRNSYGQGNSGGNGSGNSSNNSSGFGGFTRRQGNGTGTGGFSGMSGANGGFTRGAGRFNTTDLLSSLKDGMNANAEILITENKGALTVPLEAITRVGRNNYVMVKSDEKTVAALKKSGKYIDVFNSATTASGSNSSSGSTNGTGRNRNNNNQSSSSLSSSRNTLKQNEAYYKNAIPTLVEVGANNTTSMQITSGLKTGQVVLLPPLVAGSSSSSSTRTGSGLGGMLGGGAGGLGGGQFTRNSGNGGNATRSGNGANRSGSGGGN
jgi:HlyD family secretion protein